MKTRKLKADEIIRRGDHCFCDGKFMFVAIGWAGKSVRMFSQRGENNPSIYSVRRPIKDSPAKLPNNRQGKTPRTKDLKKRGASSDREPSGYYSWCSRA